MLPRLKLVLALCTLVGLGLLALSAKEYPAKTEDWMEAAIPEQLPGYAFAGSSLQGQKMDQNTYDILQPFGIVVRQYTDSAGRAYDFTVIAGNTRKSFHDPQICFSAQNWVLVNPKRRDIIIPSLGGVIPATVMLLEKPAQRGVAVYFYKDPIAWRHSPLYVPVDLTAAKLMLRDNADAQFYRFILSPATTPESATPEAVEKALQADIVRIEQFAETVFAQLAKTDDGRYFIRND